VARQLLVLNREERTCESVDGVSTRVTNQYARDVFDGLTIVIVVGGMTMFAGK
jgi:hypothetical protein